MARREHPRITLRQLTRPRAFKSASQNPSPPLGERVG
jgi:hypothetical protein